MIGAPNPRPTYASFDGPGLTKPKRITVSLEGPNVRTRPVSEVMAEAGFDQSTMSFTKSSQKGLSKESTKENQATEEEEIGDKTKSRTRSLIKRLFGLR